MNGGDLDATVLNIYDVSDVDNRKPGKNVSIRRVYMITQEAVVDIARDAIYTMIISSAPLLLVSLIVGLIISIFQTVTSIQEQTLTFVPKVLTVFVTLMICGSWILDNISGFMIDLWSNFSYYISMG